MVVLGAVMMRTVADSVVAYQTQVREIDRAHLAETARAAASRDR